MTDASNIENQKDPIDINVEVGDMVQIKRGPKKGKKGKVLIVRQNSVIVEIGTNKNTGEPIKTVVNHKNYKKGK